MKIEDYKRFFEIKHEGGWLDDNVWYAKCKICGISPIFDKYLIKNWYFLNGYQRRKRFYAAIRHHINVYHHELIPSRRTKILGQDVISDEALHFLQNFPFRPLKKEKLVEKDDVQLKFWKPGTIILPKKKRKIKRK